MTTKKDKNKKESKKLKPREELFCRLYSQNRALFGNGTQCYAQAYGYNLETLSKDDAQYEEIEMQDGSVREGKVIISSSYDRSANTCAVNANVLLRKTKIDERIAVLLREMMTDDTADSEMTFVMMQRTDLTAKNAAMREYNKLKGRIIDKSLIKHEGLSLKDLYEAAKTDLQKKP